MSKQGENKTAEAPKAEALSPVVAVHLINGVIVPGQIFVPASKAELVELEALQAVREPTEAELALFEKLSAPVAPDADVIA